MICPLRDGSLMNFRYAVRMVDLGVNLDAIDLLSMAEATESEDNY